jgi:hypothetical protein
MHNPQMTRLPTRCATRAVAVAASVAAILALASAVAARAAQPANSARTPCPHLLPLPTHAMAMVKRAVVLAMPPFEKRVHLNGRHPVVRVDPIRRSGFSYLAGGCGRIDWARSVFASVYLAHVAAPACRSIASRSAAFARAG